MLLSWGRLNKAQREQVWGLKRDAPNMPWGEVAVALGVEDFSPTCTRKAREFVEAKRLAYLAQLKRQNAEEFLDGFLHMQRAYQRLTQVETEATLEIEEERPFAVAFPADLHIGGFGTDHEALFAHAKQMAQADGLYVVLGGDAYDNMINPKIVDHSMPSIPPGSQLVLLAYYCNLLGDKLLAVCDGNHDAWSRTVAGLDGMQWLADKVKTLHAGAACLLRLRCAGAEYAVARTHKYRYSSSFNLTHTVKRLWEMGPWDFDVGIVEHQHVPALEPFVKHGIEKLALRPGTYKVNDGYALANGFFGSRIGVPIAYFWPGEKRMAWQPSWDLGQCLEYLGWLRR